MCFNVSFRVFSFVLYLRNASQHVALCQVNRVLHTRRRNAVNQVASEILQNDLLHTAPRLVKVDARVHRVLPRRRDVRTVYTYKKPVKCSIGIITKGIIKLT